MIYVAYHKPAPLLDSPSFTPIHVGRVGAKGPLAQMIGDDTGDSISSRNASYCELTGLYWAWKNGPKQDFTGLMHYRRVLDLHDTHHSASMTEIFLERFDITDWLGKTEAWLHANLEVDIVLPRMHRMGMSVEDNFIRRHTAQDFMVLRDVIAQDHPAYLDSFNAVAKGNNIRLGNIFLMRREIFERYCPWLFDILAKVEAADLNRSQYSQHQTRYLGFLAERLLTVFVAHEQAKNPALKLREVAILNSAKALVTPYDTGDDLNGPKHINVAFSADENYVPHVAAMLRSLIDHADPNRQLNLFFLHDGVKEHDLELLRELLTDHPRAYLHPLHSGTTYQSSYRSASRAPSNATYNRFLLFALLPHLERLLYLDCDIILKHDIAPLFDADLGGAQVGAVTDWIMTRTLNGRVMTADPNVPDLSAYQRDILGLNDAQMGRYFNAGVVLYNFAAIPDLAKTSETLNDMAHSGQYLFRDQDILNSYFKDALHLLDPRWNVFNSPDTSYGKVPAAAQKVAMAARRDPWIMHYADGANKPWLGKAVAGSQLYWQALIRTPFYGAVLTSIGQYEGQQSMLSGFVTSGKWLAERLPFLRVPLLRLYARLLKR